MVAAKARHAGAPAAEQGRVAKGDFSHTSRQDRADKEFLMTKLFLAMCCMLLAGCTTVGVSGSAGVDPMQSDGSIYVPAGVDGAYPRSADERPTATCTMRGQGVVCR